MRILSLDYSFSNAGYCVSSINKNVNIISSGIIYSDKTKKPIPRIIGLIQEIEKIIKKYNIDIVVRESPILGRASTAKNVLYAHAILEYTFYQKNKEIQDIHNATLKAYCRKYLIDKYFYTKEELKQFNKKEIVAEFLKAYFSSDMKEIYTERGKLLDDVSDAIALSVYYKEKML